MRISCKSSSPWDKVILPRHEGDDGRALIGDWAPGHPSLHSTSGSRFLARLVVCFASGIAALAIVHVIARHVASSWRRSSLYMRE
jgi:hypothetical protein